MKRSVSTGGGSSKKRAPPSRDRKFKGMFCAVVTPLSDTGSVSTVCIGDYARHLKAGGVAGVFVNGTAGMSMSLTVAERKVVAAAWAAAGKEVGLQVIVHVGAQSLEDSKELAAHAEQRCGVDAISSMSPSFFKPATPEALVAFLQPVAAAAPSTPFLYYHFPEITGVTLGLPGVFMALHQAVPTMAGCKFTSRDLWELGSVLDLEGRLGVTWDILNGYETMSLPAAALGVEGHIGIAFSVLAPLWGRLFAAFKANNFVAARKEQSLARRWFDGFAQICGLGQMTAVTKQILKERTGMEMGGVRPPQRMLTPGEQADITSLWRAMQDELLPPAPPDMLNLPGATGQLAGQILDRCDAVGAALQLSKAELLKKVGHLSNPCRRAGKDVGPAGFASYIDHTQLKPDATADAIDRLCREAAEHKFFAVCVNSCWVSRCVAALKDADAPVKVAAVVGFPLGAAHPAAKAFEAATAVEDGAEEIDMVINVGWLKGGDLRAVYQDVKGVVDAAGAKGGVVKVILETCLLSDTNIIDACLVCVAAGAHFVKTSTGFSTGGATPHAVDLMQAVVGDAALVKASGGVRDAAAASMYIRAGVSRIGTSSGIAIVGGCPGAQGAY